MSIFNDKNRKFIAKEPLRRKNTYVLNIAFCRSKTLTFFRDDVFVEAKRAFSKPPEPPPSGLDAQKPRILDAQDPRFSLHVRFVRQLRNFCTQSVQNASVVAINAMGMHTVTHICSAECPKCGRGAHLAVRNGDSHAFLRRRALRMRAWRSSSDWAGQQLADSR